MFNRASRIVLLSIIFAATVFVSVRLYPLAASSAPRQTTVAPGSSSVAQGGVPGFIAVGKRYSFRWAPGDTELYRVLEIRDGWIRGRRDAGNAAQEGAKPFELWLNPGQAITITEEP